MAYFFQHDKIIVCRVLLKKRKRVKRKEETRAKEKYWRKCRKLNTGGSEKVREREQGSEKKI